MGLTSSQTRKLTVENEDFPVSVIEVSENVVDRIRTSCTRMENTSGTDDEYWQNRTQHLEESHVEINLAIERERDKAYNEVHTTRAEGKLKEVPCQDYKNAVLDCYRKYNEEPMCCAKIVQAFQECVDHKRVCLLNATKTESE